MGKFQSNIGDMPKKIYFTILNCQMFMFIKKINKKT